MSGLKIRSLFPTVEKEERARLVFAVAAFMCVASVGVVARTAGSALFLSHFPASSLAPMYVASAALLMATAFGFGWLVARLSLVRVITMSSVALVVLTLLLRVAAATSWKGSSAAAIYLFSDLLAKLPALLFWSFAATMFNPRQAKRLFVLVGAGGTLACVFAGALVGPFAKVLGTENLLFPIALLLAGFGAVIWRWIGTQGSGDAPRVRGARAGIGLSYYGELLKLPQVKNLALLALIASLTLLLTDFVFKSEARAHYVAADLAAFFGLFYSATSLTALGFQIFLVHTILRRGGVLLAATLLPALVLVMSIGVALTGAFGWVIAAKFVDPVFDFTVSAAAMQLLYLGIRKQSRSGARALIEGVAKPVAATIGGLFLFAFAGSVAPRAIAAVAAVGAALWLLVAVKTCKSYVAGLLESIGVHHFDPSDEALAFDDPVIERHLREALRTAPDEEVLYLLGIAAHMDQIDLRGEFRELLSREKVEIKVAALDYLREQGKAEDADWARREIGNGAPEVRRAAIRALAGLARGDAAPEIAHHLDDPDPEVRAAATTELINVGDLDGLLAACISLKEMLRSEDERARAAAAKSLARVSHTGLAKLLGDLLADPDPTVRGAALRACTERPDPRLIPAVLPLLADPDLAANAVDTLGVFGSQVIAYLRAFPRDARGPAPEKLLLVPAVLAQTGDAAALAILEDALDVPDVRLRSRVVSAYCDLVGALPRSQRSTVVLEKAALREIATSQQRAAMIRTLGDHEDAQLLSRVLEEERLDLLGNAFVLIGALHPKVNIRSILWVLRGGTPEKRAEALEVLDNVLDGELKSQLFAVFEPAGEPSPVAVGEDSQIAKLLSGEHSEWIVASAAYTTGRTRGVSSLDTIRELLGRSSPYVREAALDAFSRLAAPDEVRLAAERLASDPNDSVKKVAMRLLKEGRA